MFHELLLKFLNLRKSNFIKPIFSTYFIENCVTGISDFGSLYKGTDFFKSSSEITIPAAWVEACLNNPSRFFEISKIFLMFGSLEIIFFIFSSFSINSDNLFVGQG